MSRLSDVKRRMVLGIEGDKAWKQGESWQKYMRNWRGLVEPDTRLSKAAKDVKIIRSQDKTFVFNLQLHASKDIWLPPAEYAMITKELNTWLAGSKNIMAKRYLGRQVMIFTQLRFASMGIIGLLINDR